jgi:hypothetical protein
MMHIFFCSFAICLWISLGIVGAGYLGGFFQRTTGKIKLFDIFQMLGCIIFGPVGLFMEWLISDDGGMDWIELPKYKSKGQKFLEKLES